jgi:hypothetical protein
MRFYEIVYSSTINFSYRLQKVGPRTMLAAGAVQPGLVLHELATNAWKYGALCAGRPVIINRGFDDGNETAPESFCMEWREREAVPSNRPRARDFGRFVTDRMVTRAQRHRPNGFRPTDCYGRCECPQVRPAESWSEPGRPGETRLPSRGCRPPAPCRASSGVPKTLRERSGRVEEGLGTYPTRGTW